MEHYFAPGDGEWESREIRVWLEDHERFVETADGVFSSEHVDAGTRILLETVPAATGRVLDIGCGWGAIALAAALREPGAEVWAVDVNERALELTRRNAARLGCDGVHVSAPDDVPADLRFDTIWSNPPIRVGKAELHAILERWLPRLVPGGSAFLVVAKKLGAESLMRWLAETWPMATVSKAETTGGFWVIEFRVAD
jgi:16S rRNA G1207 methylase RsmC